jgi:hypothetical protein
MVRGQSNAVELRNLVGRISEAHPAIVLKGIGGHPMD